ncbi:hypothetical protein NPIL_418061 [Nephila pilipes]|uniref:Uncharacterized protein n=1 Tax=Nephila pilipes TaxID=299642 RepID=A0A8X6NQG2_NEPPI|nr:hypothetical protein NPIL_418061 [Nephila pilipes]
MLRKRQDTSRVKIDQKIREGNKARTIRRIEQHGLSQSYTLASKSFIFKQSPLFGNVNEAYTQCKTLKFKSEAPEICYLNEVDKLPELNAPSEPLFPYVASITEKKRFLNNRQIITHTFE